MRSIQYDTNFNNKLTCESFVHITFAPVNLIPEHLLEQPMLITVADNDSLKIEVITLDLCRLKLKDLRSHHTLPSHGMLCYEFIDWWRIKYPNSSEETDMAIYYHKQLKK